MKARVRGLVQRSDRTVRSAFDRRFDETGREEGKQESSCLLCGRCSPQPPQLRLPKMDGKDSTTDMACYAASRRRGRGARGSKSIDGMA
jgi:hypothetical protein